MDNRELFHHIEDQMMQRINKTVLVDDAYRREREWRASTGQNEPPARDARYSTEPAPARMNRRRETRGTVHGQNEPPARDARYSTEPAPARMNRRRETRGTDFKHGRYSCCPSYGGAVTPAILVVKQNDDKRDVTVLTNQMVIRLNKKDFLYHKL
ncbi:hypothetical protein MSG28_008267 [Choristoneura fumiferana]|uniref:Uncharacterized protein n=1 Tax=Choristoneura fumiferana TaxID=7141 RepID=A0ACC0JAZ7_CHOFU|nr:hypothetical protein MSG28_008267 [Choristoneura fumiferana]